MGKLDGYKQVTVYVEPELYDRVVQVSNLLGVPTYQFINEALTRHIPVTTTREQRRAVDAIVNQRRGRRR